MLLKDLLPLYWRERPGMEPESLNLIMYSLNKFALFLGRDSTESDLTRDTLLDFMRWMSSRVAPRTVNHHRGNLIQVWNFAVEKNLAPPPPKIRKAKEPTRTPIAWTLEEMQQLYAATDLLEGEWDGVPIRLAWKIAVSMMWDTGCRVGTLAKADLAELNLSTGIWIAPAEHIKGGQADRVFRLHPDTMKIIKQSAASKRKKIFPFPYKRRTLFEHFDKLLILAGLPHTRKRKFHCLRRSAESHAASVLGIEWAAAAVGHSVAVAKKSYISPEICAAPALIEALPRPF